MPAVRHGTCTHDIRLRARLLSSLALAHWHSEVHAGVGLWLALGVAGYQLLRCASLPCAPPENVTRQILADVLDRMKNNRA